MELSKPIWLETLGIRLRGLLKTTVRVVGILLVLFAVYNMFAAPLFDLPVHAPYREWGVVLASNQKGYYIGDVLLIGLGSIIAWFT